jgi:hypothetical protein
LGIGATDGEVLVDLLAGDFVDELEELGVGGSGRVVCIGREEHLVADRRGEGDNLDAVSEGKVLFGDGTGSDAAWDVLVYWEEERMDGTNRWSREHCFCHLHCWT